MRNLFIAFALSATLTSAAQEARLKIYLDPITDQILNEIGIERDHGIRKAGHFIIHDFTAEEREALDNEGITYEIIIDQLSTYYQERSLIESARINRNSCFESNNDSLATPSGFNLGSMGGFYTYEEFTAHLDTMAAIYPNLITIKAPIDTFESIEGRPIFWVKISDNPNVNETEPEILYTAVHHAREPESLTQLIFYMYYLLENYGSNAEVTNLVNETEMYFIPMINPDGYIRNQTTNPNGGGLWRKNRRDNGNGTMGVDLNRNYGHEWGYDNSGSSPNSNSETFRGTAAFSEPETQAVKWFCENHTFDFALNYHSFGNYVIYPWGYIPSPLTPDSNAFLAFAEALTATNNYVAGTGYQTVGYATNGDSDDWMYGEQTSKNKIFSMTPEVGNSGDGFWPAQSRIIPIAKDNVKPNLLLAHFAGNYITATDKSPLNISNTSGNIEVDVTRMGLLFNQTHEVKLVPISSNISSSTSSQIIASIALGETQTIQLPFTLNANIQNGDEVAFELQTVMGNYTHRQLITKTYGTLTSPIASTELISEFNTFGWNTTTEDFTSAPVSFTDSPNALYENNAFSEIEYRRTLDLRNATQATLSFDAKWDIEAGWDYCEILISPATEENYLPACGLFTKEGNEYQDEGQPIWDGTQNLWIREYIDLNDYLGQRVKAKFRLVSDGFVTYDGFYFDNLEINLMLDPNYTGAIDTGYWDTLGAFGLNEMELNPKIWTLYPNPGNTELFLKSNTQRSASTISIIDIRGNVVLLENHQQSQFVIQTGNLKPGSYIIEINAGNAIERQLWLKE